MALTKAWKAKTEETTALALVRSPGVTSEVTNHFIGPFGSVERSWLLMQETVVRFRPGAAILQLGSTLVKIISRCQSWPTE